MRNCYFSKNYTGIRSGGNKARVDMEKIMSGSGYINVGLPQTQIENKALGFLITLIGVIKAFFSIRKGDMLVLQYPLKKYYKTLCVVAHWKGAKVVTLVHDLGSFRRKKLTIEQEKRRLSHTDYIIALNPSMKNWLVGQGYNQPIGILGIWDYLSEQQPPVQQTGRDKKQVIYVGDLGYRKHSFMYKLDKEQKDFGCDFVIYGSKFHLKDINHQDAVAYKGFVYPDDLIRTATGDYGLVWYGHSIDEIDGPYGEYLRITTSHKLSLYLRCHIPLIVWSQSATVAFVKEHQIGICLDNLRDLGEQMARVSEEEYKQMVENCKQLSEKVSEGYFFKQALKEARTCLEESV